MSSVFTLSLCAYHIYLYSQQFPRIEPNHVGRQTGSEPNGHLSLKAEFYGERMGANAQTVVFSGVTFPLFIVPL